MIDPGVLGASFTPLDIRFLLSARFFPEFVFFLLTLYLKSSLNIQIIDYLTCCQLSALFDSCLGNQMDYYDSYGKTVKKFGHLIIYIGMISYDHRP
jgi:hypothetical protein